MKISDLSQEQIHPGLQLRNLKDSFKTGTIVYTDEHDDFYSWILWNGETEPRSGFYGNDCECEVIEESIGQPLSEELKTIWMASERCKAIIDLDAMLELFKKNKEQWHITSIL